MSNENIFREVDEELRGDRLRALWRRYGPYVIVGAVLVVIGVGANEGWRWWQNSNAARSSDLFYSALETAEKGDIAGAQAALNTVVANGSGGYPMLAQFRQAALLGRDGKTAEAVAAYDALATAQSSQRIRELALILAANLLVDGGDVAAVQQRVGGLVDPSNPLRNAAREAIGLTQYKAGDLTGAVKTFGDIASDPLATTDMRNRVLVYLGQLVSLGADLGGEDDSAAASDATPLAPAETPAVTTTAVPVETASAPATTATPAETAAAPTTTVTPAETAAAAPTTTVAPVATTAAPTATVTPSAEPVTPTTTVAPSTTTVPGN